MPNINDRLYLANQSDLVSVIVIGMGKSIHRNSLAWDLLRAVGAGAVVASLFVAPNIGLALAPFLRGTSARERREWQRVRVREALARLRAHRLVQFRQKGNQTYLEITEYGRRRLAAFEFDQFTLPLPKNWDGKWRLVIFDIPEKRKRERHAFRRRLADLGFFQLQKSVWVYPHPCQDEVDFLCHFLDVDRWVHYLEAISLAGAEGRVRRHFGLLV